MKTTKLLVTGTYGIDTLSIPRWVNFNNILELHHDGTPEGYRKAFGDARQNMEIYLFDNLIKDISGVFCDSSTGTINGQQARILSLSVVKEWDNDG